MQQCSSQAHDTPLIKFNGYSEVGQLMNIMTFIGSCFGCVAWFQPLVLTAALHKHVRPKVSHITFTRGAHLSEDAKLNLAK